MKKTVTALVVVLTAFFFTHAGTARANPIDRFIGQIHEWDAFPEVNGKGNEEVILYHGDVLVMERDNRNGKVYVIGKYYTDAYTGTAHPIACIMPLERTGIAPPHAITFNFDLSHENIDTCK